MGESTAVLLFVCAVAAVYLFAALAFVRVLLRRFGFMEQPTRGERIAERASFVLATVGLVCFAYGHFVEPFWPEVTHVRIESPKLKGAQRPVRVVHISDLHCDPEPRLEERLPDLIAAERPDLIVYTGDSINSPEGLPVLRKLLPRLARVAPTYVARGNWDTGYWKNRDLFGETGVHELHGSAAEVKVAGTTLWVAGAASGTLYEPTPGAR